MDSLSLHPRTTALLIVDIQERLVPAMPPAHAKRLLASVDLLIEAARALEIPVLLTEQYPKGLGPTVPTLRAQVESLSPPAVIAEKTVFSAADPPAIVRALASYGTRSVIVVGMEAHVCVFQTARDLSARGFYVHVPFDAVCSRSPGCRDTALRTLAARGVTVTTTETVVFDLLHDAQHPAFRALSKRVKDLPLDE